ncbi:MAG: hypothetical protein KatS3mg059_0416 [Thermomicrobiales bacterium]|nr:MAG: hypothetical protein KatS3mg059_0416 [Thermomicrobiales bacterium]
MLLRRVGTSATVTVPCIPMTQTATLWSQRSESRFGMVTQRPSERIALAAWRHDGSGGW